MLTVAEGYSQWMRRQKDAEQDWAKQMQAAFEASKVQGKAGESIAPAVGAEVDWFTQQRFGAWEIGRTRRTFGWVGVCEARVEHGCAGMEQQLKELVGEKKTWPGSRYRVRQGWVVGEGASESG